MRRLAYLLDAASPSRPGGGPVGQPIANRLRGSRGRENGRRLHGLGDTKMPHSHRIVIGPTIPRTAEPQTRLPS